MDFAGSEGTVVLSAEAEINLKLTSLRFKGTLAAWAQLPVRVLVPAAFQDPRSRRLSYVNAGHNPPVILRQSSTACQVFRLEIGGPVIGLLQQCYQQASFLLEAADLAVLFTDGVSESMNACDEEWGEDRLIEYAKTCHGLPAFDAMTRILAASEAFAAGASQHDDMTLVVLRVFALSADSGSSPEIVSLGRDASPAHADNRNPRFGPAQTDRATRIGRTSTATASRTHGDVTPRARPLGDYLVASFPDNDTH